MDDTILKFLLVVRVTTSDSILTISLAFLIILLLALLNVWKNLNNVVEAVVTQVITTIII